MARKWWGKDRGETPEPSVTVTDTGNAEAAGRGTAVTGYRGPALEADHASPAQVSVDKTGHASATDGGIANSGYIDELNVYQRLPQEPAAWPHQVGVVPPPARSYLHRAETVRLRAMADGGTMVLTQLLTGMGGVGKTQLAADYALTAWNDESAGGGLDVLVWVTASTRSAIVAGYAQAGVELCRGNPDDPEQAARTFLAWLAPKTTAKPCRWLVVLDDLADSNDLQGLQLPENPHGRTLITTRRRDSAVCGMGRNIEVGLFAEAEALAYLTNSLADHGREESAGELADLAGELGYLPLALAQAAAYLIDTGESVAGYRELLADRTLTLADAAPDSLPDGQALPLAAAWSLSIDRADTLRPAGLARPLLALTALLDPNGIPQDVLTSAPALTHLAANRTPTSEKQPGDPAPVSARDARQALSALHRLSLIDHDRDAPHKTVRVHQLIQRTTRDTLTPDQHDAAARTAADALLAAWPAIERDTTLAQTLRTNTTALATCSGAALWQPNPHTVLFRTGTSLGNAGQVTAARDHFHTLHTDLVRVLGPDHPDTLGTRHNLASWRGEAGDAAGAATAFAELLTDRLRVLGPDHPDTLTTRHNLASWRGEAGDAAGAATATAELLTDRLRVLGPDHPDTLATRHNLAYWRGEAGDAVGAATAFAELLTDRLRVLGPDHPHTLTTRHNLASWRGEAGDAVGAATAFAELLTDRLCVLGPDHPQTLTTRHNLAYWRGEAGDAAGAATAFAELLTDCLRVLGPDHPGTLATRNNLASWRGKAGDAAGAATAFAELLTDRLRVLGPDHPDTLATRSNLAYWRGKAGDAAGAATAFAELLTDRLRVLGPDHPDTLATRSILASWRGEAGESA
ncbi:tetratricopeptide repeat protein [Streptomyces sp. SL13]|uniref:Tetratricopeptide repeat protein n=1 Tax=Streptantibioticus silvisoli TaxID=2705255 RepID=A0AA90KF82_9ACTN|nr:tetratricopeptide repeat protein [Streptantibioticus silvisoli]MDI5968925.1 tetratricopeptide repeat protein [Streptantibioticus silvisoli]